MPARTGRSRVGPCSDDPRAQSPGPVGVRDEVLFFVPPYKEGEGRNLGRNPLWNPLWNPLAGKHVLSSKQFDRASIEVRYCVGCADAHVVLSMLKA